MCIHTLTVEVDFQLTVDLVCLSSYVEWLQLPGTVLGMGHAVASKKKKKSQSPMGLSLIREIESRQKQVCSSLHWAEVFW